MSAATYDSALYRDLFRPAEMAALFSDGAEVRAMLIVEGALARAQGAAGLIPELSGEAIHRAALEVQIDPAGLAAETGRSAVPVPALVAAFRTAMQAPEHAQWIHYGATSQDILDTGLALRLRQALSLAERDLRALLTALAAQAEAHAETPMAARTYGQVATITTFGAQVAAWGWPLLACLDELPALRDRLLRVSLSGAAGTLSAMGERGPAIRAGLAANLGLADPGHSWHTDRSGIAALSGWAGRVTTATGKIGADLVLMTRSGAAEMRLATSGASSTMPQKQNPVLPSLLVSLARMGTALDAAIQGAALQQEARDGAAWITEWMALPQVVLGVGRALEVAGELARSAAPDIAAMRAGIDDGTGLIHAEALSFALARAMPRPEAQAAVKDLCARVRQSGTPLPRLAAEAYPELIEDGFFAPSASWGTAPAEALGFVRAVSDRGPGGA